MHEWHGTFSVILCLKVYCDKIILNILRIIKILDELVALNAIEST